MKSALKRISSAALFALLPAGPACGGDGDANNRGPSTDASTSDAASGGAASASGGTATSGGRTSSSGGRTSGTGGRSPGSGGSRSTGGGPGAGGASSSGGGDAGGALDAAPDGNVPDPACSQADSNGFFSSCAPCPTSNCDTIDTGGSPRSACGCSGDGDCPCGFTCGCYEIVPGIGACDLCVR